MQKKLSIRLGRWV